MERDWRKRLGCSSPGSPQTFLDFQEDPWFDDIDWDKLTNKEIQPPFVPDVCSSPLSLSADSEYNAGETG
jgi:serine/threonine kinase 32